VHIEPHHIEKLRIPILPIKKQQEIHNLIKHASNLRVNANKLLKEALLAIESQFTIDSAEKTYSVSINDILKGDKYTKEKRLESDYYQPKTTSVIKSIKKGKWAYLGDLCHEIHRSGLRDRKFVESGIPLITGQNLNLARVTDLKMLSRKFTKHIEKNTTEESDVLISVQGTIGKVEYVYKNMYENVFASEQISKVRVDSKKIHPGYIFAFLRSKAGKAQLLKHKTGSVIEWIKENNIASIIIPVPGDNGILIGTKVNELTLMFQEAFTSENKAIELVEKEMELWQK
jgi:type I restriction enzyme S subunit